MQENWSCLNISVFAVSIWWCTYMFCSILLQRQRMKSMNQQSAFHFISISVFLFHCISYFCSSVFLLHCKSLYFFAAQYSWRRGSKSLVQLLMLDKWSSPLGPLRTYTLIYFWSPPFISCDNSLKFSIFSNGKMRSPSVRPTEDLYSHLLAPQVL